MNIVEAARDGHFNEVKKFLENGVDPNTQSTYGRTPLIVACARGRMKIIKLLLENGADINLKNDRGDSPLTVAISWDRIEIAKLLIDHGADIHMRCGPSNRTPLYHASIRRQNGLVKLLLELGADVNAKMHDRRTPLSVASSYGCFNISRLLLRHGADMNVINKYGFSILKMIKEPNVTLLFHKHSRCLEEEEQQTLLNKMYRCRLKV